MFGLSDIDINTIKNILASSPEVEQAIMFGSRAKGNYKPGSDIDIALKGQGLTNIVWKIHDQLEEETRMPYFFDVLDYDAIASQDLKNHIDRVGVVLYGK